MTDRLRTAWRFFQAHAGYCTPPGRAACALSLAKAEAVAREEGLLFHWEDDSDGMPRDGVCSCGCGKPIQTCEGCICTDADGNVLASLWGIWDADGDYRRVVEAELAEEAFGQMMEREAATVRQL